MPKCAGCGDDYKRQTETADSNTWRSDVSQSFCPKCRSTDAHGRRKQSWDWADALCKSTAQAVRIKQGTEGMWTYQVDAPMLRALWRLQHGRCAVTGLPMQAPGSGDELQVKESLDTWAARFLTKPQRDYVVTAVRADRSSDWEPGNVVLIIKVMAPVCGLGPNIAGVMNGIKQAPAPLIPSAATLRNMRAVMACEPDEPEDKEDKDV